MKSLNEDKMQQKFEKIVAFNSEKDRDNLDLFILQYEILQEIQKLLDIKNMSRSDLAERLNTSKSFVTQLFTGDKTLNLKHILAFQRIFNKKFVPSFQSKDISCLEVKYSNIDLKRSLNRSKIVYPDFITKVSPEISTKIKPATA